MTKIKDLKLNKESEPHLERKKSLSSLYSLTDM